MSPFSSRPQLESLDGRCLPSGNPAITIGDVSLAVGVRPRARLTVEAILLVDGRQCFEGAADAHLLEGVFEAREHAPDPRGRFGPGVAYSTPWRFHRLNVRAEEMGAPPRDDTR